MCSLRAAKPSLAMPRTPVSSTDGIVNRDQRPRRADRGVPAAGPVDFLDHFELLAGGRFRPGEPCGVDYPVREVPRRHRHAAHVEALHQAWLELAPEDEFGAAAADVEHEPGVELVFQEVRYAEVDQPRFLATADDFHAVAEDLLRRVDEVPAVARLAQRVGANDAHVGVAGGGGSVGRNA